MKKKTLKKINKLLHLIVVLSMLFQPIGVQGLLIAIAENTVENQAAIVKEEPKEEEVKESEEESVKKKVEERVEKKVEEKSTSTKSDSDLKRQVTEEKKEVEIITETKVKSDSNSKEEDKEKKDFSSPETDETSQAENNITEKADDVNPVVKIEEKKADGAKENEKETWLREGKKAETNEPVETGKKYVAPQNDEVSVTFTKLPENPSKLSIEEIELSAKQVDALGALSNKAYDVTSDMEDGTFEYEIILPKPATEKNVQIKYAEKKSDLDEAKTVEENDVKVENEKVSAKLDHFTLFFVATSSTVDLVIMKTNDASGEARVGGSFNWKIEISNKGNAVANFNGNDKVLVDQLPTSGATYGVPTSVKSSNASGKVDCLVSNNVLTCVSESGSNKLVIPAGEKITIALPVTPTVAGNLVNPRTSGACKVNPDNKVSEVNDGNNFCVPNTVKIIKNEVTKNPTLSEACGLDIALVLDNSSSINSSELGQMKSAMKKFTNALSGAPTRFSVTKFATKANVIQGFTADVSDVNDAIDGISTNGGFTNWQDGLNKAKGTFDPRTNPNLVIFASDGNPNRTGASGATVSEIQAVTDAVLVANSIKSGGTRILALGIGSDLDTENMKAISGSNVNTGNFLTSDVITTDFSGLADQLENFARQTCGGTITVRKYLDDLNHPAGAGVQFNINGSTYSTDADGITEAVQVPSGNYLVAESSTPIGYGLSSAVCRNQEGETVGSWSAFPLGVKNVEVSANDIISCDFINTKNQICGDGIKNGTEECDGTDLGGLLPANFFCKANCELDLINPAVTICHATDIYNNPYIKSEESKSGDVSGHNSHSGGIWYFGIDHSWGDIIPPFDYIGGKYPGKNWTMEGQAILENGCKVSSGNLRVRKEIDLDGNGTYEDLNNTVGFKWSYDGDATERIMDTEVSLPYGEYEVNETSADGFRFTGWYSERGLGGDCSFSCSNPEGTTYPVPVTVSSEDENASNIVLCNTRNVGLITFEKSVIGGNPSDWTFSIAGMPGTYKNGDSVLLPTGTYSVTESGPAGYLAVSVGGACSGLDGSSATLEVTKEGGTCTFTNSRDSFCGDGVINNQEQCDGVSGVIEGKNFCSAKCELIPIYDGDDACPENKPFKKLINAYSVSSQDADGISVPVVAGRDYLLEASGTFSPTSSSGYVSDAGYTNFNGSLASQYGIHGTGSDYAAHALLGNLGSGVGVINWGNYDSSHVYNKAYLGSQSSLQFVIGDRYGDWFNTAWQNQSGMSDNNGDLTLKVYECVKGGTISGFKFEDKNWNGEFNSGENRLSGWTIFIDENRNGIKDTTEKSAVTTSGGYSFSGLSIGTHSICEVPKSGWQSSLPGGTNCQEVEVSDERKIFVNFGNYQVGWVEICKIIVDSEGNVVDGSSFPESNFSITGFTPNPKTSEGNPVGVLPLTNFSTSLSLNKTILKNSTKNDAECVTYNNLKLGGYYYGEENIDVSGWENPKYNDQFTVKADETADLFSYDEKLFDGNSYNDNSRNKNADGHIVLSLARPNRTLVILNQYKPITISAQKIVCANEADLPNWGNGGADITETSAADWVAEHESCELESDWQFQWSLDGVGNPGDNLGIAGIGWNTFGTEDIEIFNPENSRLWFREVLRPDYLQFAYAESQNNSNNVSAEFYCGSDVLNYDNWEWIDAVPGQKYHCVAWNVLAPGSVEVIKYADNNGNGIWDDGEEALSNWEIILNKLPEGTQINQKTGNGENGTVLGETIFDDLSPGEYNLYEVIKSNWTQTNISCSSNQRQDDGEFFSFDNEIDNDNEHRIVIEPNEKITCHIGNMSMPELKIEKSNDAVAPQAPGTDVLYTIKVTALENSVLGVQVVDLPPAGFKYRGGSWKAVSSMRGDLSNFSGLGLTHIYASPGEWTLGDMEKNEVVTLSYVADIDNNQDSGIYKDVAWAEGTAQNSDPVIANSDNETVQFFVGTDVEVVRQSLAEVEIPEVTETETKTKTKTKTRTVVGEVLGASIVLPETGTNTMWLILSIGAIAMGFVLLVSKKRKEKNMKILGFLLVGVISSIFFAFGLTVDAASSSISVQMEKPASPELSNDFKIGFVVLDINGGTPDVKCQVDRGAGFVDFPGGHIEYNSIAGGNSGSCLVDEAVVTTNGTYTFRVVADSNFSNEETVLVDTNVPDEPLNYDRDGDNCDVSFTTANDGITSRIELYRSTENNFLANASTLATTLAIGPNSDGLIIDPNGNCDDYYYAIRAVSANGAGSGFVGDEDVNVETETKTKTKTKTKTIYPTAGTTVGAIPVGGVVEEGIIAGVETTAPSIEGENDEEGEVLGAETAEEKEIATSQSFLQRNWLWMALLIILAGGSYAIYRKRRNGQSSYSQ